jgi:hypothetical protein
VHKIVFWRGARELAEKPWQYGLEAAKSHAESHLATYGATRVDVVDMTSRAVIFSYSGEAAGDRHAAE